MKNSRKGLMGCAGILLLGLIIFAFVGLVYRPYTYFSVNRQEPPGLTEVDDRLEDKNPEFDEKRVDSRPIDGWEVNQSGAVIRIHSRDPWFEPRLFELRPSYSDCIAQGRHVFPSANMLDGAAKQFDDGLCAALDQACYRGELGGNVPGAVGLVSDLFDRIPEGSPAKAFLAAALQLAGRDVNFSSKAKEEVGRLIEDFESNAAVSKPISFYTWTPELERVWKFYRFLQREFAEPWELRIPAAVAKVLSENADLLKKYESLQQFYSRLTNPLVCLPASALMEATNDLKALAGKYHARHAAAAIFPPSTNRESELFERVFPDGIPGNVESMTELIKRIRSGEVDLQPKPEDGWYQYQVYALECLLNPSKDQESERLLLSADYKRRLVEAFKVMFSKRRETHALFLNYFTLGDKMNDAPQMDRPVIAPRLRIEPCATLYLRNARAYAFLQNFLLATISAENLNAIHGLREGGNRAPDLGEELESMRLRTYGFYLVTCEDIGMAPKFLEGEPVDQDAAKRAALDWLDQIGKDPDLTCDTRAAVPIYYDPMARRVRLWVALGIRMAHLDASYARPPRIRPMNSDSPWREVNWRELRHQDALIPVEEFAEVELSADKIPNHAELRALCDKYKTKEDIIDALQHL